MLCPSLSREHRCSPGAIDEPVRAGEDGDEGTLKLLDRRVTDRLLPDLDMAD